MVQSAKTGTGKTTAACEILKQYIYDSVWESAHGRPLPQLPEIETEAEYTQALAELGVE